MSGFIPKLGTAAALDVGTSTGKVPIVPVPMASMSSPVKVTIDGITQLEDSAAFHEASEFATADGIGLANIATIDLGVDPIDTGSFQITGLNSLVVGTPVIVQQAIGDEPDEGECDQLMVSAKILDSHTIQAYFVAYPGPVSGEFLFNYKVGS